MVFYIMRFARQFATTLLPATAGLAILAANRDIQLAWILSGILILVVLGAIGSLLSYLRFWFCVSDDQVLVRSGVVHREELSIEFNRVQNITMREPFYMRPFGLATLSIDTAGSGQKDVILGGIAKPVARALRETILSGKHAAKTDEVNAPAREIEPTLLLARSRRDIAIYGLTVNFMLWVAVAFGALAGSYNSSETFFLWLARSIRIEELLGATDSDGGVAVGVLVIAGLILVVLLLLPLISVIGALFRYYGYRLTVDGETYTKSSGLLSRHGESLKRHKIQAVVWKQTMVASWFRRINIQLRVASAGSEFEGGQLPTGTKSTFLVPALHPAEAIALTAEFLPNCKPGQVLFSSVDRRHYTLKTLARRWLPLIVGVSVIPIIVLDWKFVLTIPIALGFAWPIVHQCWRKLGYAVVGEYGFVQTGFIGTQTTVFPLFKVQRIDARQTPFQRRAGLANLTIHLASHSLTMPYIRVKDAGLLRNLALYYVESTDRAWY